MRWAKEDEVKDQMEAILKDVDFREEWRTRIVESVEKGNDLAMQLGGLKL